MSGKPFSIRLSFEERAQLERAAGSRSLGAPANDQEAKRQAFIAQRQRQARKAQERQPSRGPDMER